MVSTLAAQTVAQVTATVVRIKGSARCKIGGSGWQPLKRGDVLRAGALIETGGDGSYVDLVLGARGAPPALRPAAGDLLTYHPTAEQNTVRVWQNTRLGIDKLTAMETGADVVTETQLDLQAGHILANVKKMSAASKYDVKVPNGVASIRGSTVEISVEERVTIKVLTGSVYHHYIDVNGKEHNQIIMSLQEYDDTTGMLTPLPDSDKTGMGQVSDFMVKESGTTGAGDGTVIMDATVTLISPH
jgi:hypothetical protein